MNPYPSIQHMITGAYAEYPQLRQQSVRIQGSMLVWNGGLNIHAILYSRCPQCNRVFSDLEIQSEHICLDALYGHMVHADNCCRNWASS